MGAFPLCPYRHAAPLEMTVLAAPLSSFRPKRSGVEKSHALMTEKPARALCHFDESVAEWRNLPLMVRAALRQEISRLRASWARFPSAPIAARSPAQDDERAVAPCRPLEEDRKFPSPMAVPLPPMGRVSLDSQRPIVFLWSDRLSSSPAAVLPFLPYHT